MTTRVLVADDHAAIRSGLRLILEAAGDIEVVAEAADGAAAVTNARALRPDVVLMDIRMPGMDGITATRTLTGERLADVLVLTTFDLDEYVFGALRAGAAGFLLKTADAATLVDAVRRVGAGEGVLAPEVTRRLLATFAATPGPGQDAGADDGARAAVAELTAREREVLAGLGRGLSNAGLAADLGVSPATAKTHVSRVLAKLGCTSRVQAAILAREAGLV
ncbi:response regulator transcription factor [Georgenia sp. TF02-10]|uniref:response regulator transcription factor n=1 Tax=Georgenia sp. TF02-10 TaxID=2917725 RepID=UPI001FA6ACF5|nr:response regulator transcription factor [Georgenia sp. TF02-10]UNX55162.1 response regulator transcription factor [Georgenia sp. TF02-10]